MKSGISLTTRAVLCLIGFTAVISQVVLMREFVVVFYGNEISFGLFLTNWLIWTAVGSSLLGRLATRWHQPRKLMVLLQMLIAVVLPSTVVALRAIKTVFHATPGEILGPGLMFLSSFVILGLFCAFSGWLFAAGSRLYAVEVGGTTALATSSVYLYEAVGSGLGGLLASLLLLRFLNHFEIILLLVVLNLSAAMVLTLGPSWRFHKGRVVLVLVALFTLFFGGRLLDSMSLRYLWRGFHLVDTHNSIYGNLAVVATEGSQSLFENGLVVFTVPDPASSEEAVHYALLQHPSPRSLLLIGGGVSGSLAQALQHPTLKQVDYVELDPAILGLARKHFPEDWLTIEADPRVSIHHIDGRLFLKRTRNIYDVIIVNLPDPQTAQLNRFYTLEFFREAAEKLTPGGLLAFKVTGAENYISAELAQFLRCVNKTLRLAFADVTTIPGATIHFFAASQPGVLTTEPSLLVKRLQTRQIQTMYVREYYIPFRMMPDRMADLQMQIEPLPDTPTNQDFAPIAYYFDVALWSSRFHVLYRQLFEAIARVKFKEIVSLMILALLGLAGLLYWRLRHAKRLQASTGLCVAAMGFTLLGLEILLLIAFQAIYGYVYHQLAIVITGFMVGMALGSWWSRRSIHRSNMDPTQRSDVRLLAGLQVLAALTPLLMYALFLYFAGIETPTGLFIISQIGFPALALLSGMLGGYQFPLASRVYFNLMAPSDHGPGTVYALDLAGACLGAIVLSVYLIPLFGTLKTTLVLGLVNLMPTALLVLSYRKMQSHK